MGLKLMAFDTTLSRRGPSGRGFIALTFPKVASRCGRETRRRVTYRGTTRGRRGFYSWPASPLLRHPTLYIYIYIDIVTQRIQIITPRRRFSWRVSGVFFSPWDARWMWNRVCFFPPVEKHLFSSLWVIFSLREPPPSRCWIKPKNDLFPLRCLILICINKTLQGQWMEFCVCVLVCVCVCVARFVAFRDPVLFKKTCSFRSKVRSLTWITIFPAVASLGATTEFALVNRLLVCV